MAQGLGLRVQDHCPQPPAHSPQRFTKGQALVELAVFGSMLLMLLGYLVNNVLTSDYRQQSATEAFRQGLSASAATTAVSVSGPTNTPKSISNLLVQDRHIPNPGDPFAVGSVAPMFSQAGITRNYQLQIVPDVVNELPRMAIQIENATACPEGTRVPSDFRGGMRTCYYTTSGFRDENVAQENLGRYRFVYGASNICEKPDCGGGNLVCTEWCEEPYIDPETGEEVCPCIRYAKHIRIVDSCAGEIIGYANCKGQARQITDSAACEAACVQSSMTDCATICSQPMLVPWYAGAGVLDAMFVGSGIAAMGVQPGGLQVVAQKNQLTKQESPEGITTTSDVNRTETTTRSIIRVGATDTIQSQHTDQSTTVQSTPW